MIDDRIDVPLPFPRHSALRLVMRERIVQFSGLRALLLQGLDPVMVAGFLEHTDAFRVPDATGIRLIRTGLQMNRIYFLDDPADIQRLCAGLRRGHSYINGVLPDSAGALAGKPYAADAPAALLWVIATLADSAWNFYARWRGGDAWLREAF